jgi:hypothetical protein
MRKCGSNESEAGPALKVAGYPSLNQARKSAYRYVGGRMGQIDEHPSPTLVERLFTYAYSGNPDYTKWAEAHNAAAAEDSRAFQGRAANLYARSGRRA